MGINDDTKQFLLDNLEGTVSDLVRCLKKIDFGRGTMWQDVKDAGESHGLYKCLKCNDPYNVREECFDYRSKYYFHKKGLGDDNG